MQTPISLSSSDPAPTLETLTPGDTVWFVTGGYDLVCPPGIDQAPIHWPAIRWPAQIVRFAGDRPDGPMDLRVLTHSGWFLCRAVPFDETRADQTWHLPASQGDENQCRYHECNVCPTHRPPLF